MGPRELLDWLPVALGAYAALLVTAAVSVVTRQSVLAPPVLVAAAVAGLSGYVLGVGIPDMGVRLSATRLHYALVGVPVGAAFAIGGWSMLGRDLSSEAAVLSIVVVVASVPAGAVLVTADNRRVRRLRDTASASVHWQGTPAPVSVRRWKRVYAGLGLGLIVTGVALIFVAGSNGTFAMATGGGILGQYMNVNRTREFAVYDQGIVVTHAGAIRSHLIEWERIEGYSLTDEALTLDRWLPGSSLSVDWRDIENGDAVTAALDMKLDRHSG